VFHLIQIQNDLWGSEARSAGVLDLGTRRRWAGNFTLLPIYPPSIPVIIEHGAG